MNRRISEYDRDRDAVLNIDRCLADCDRRGREADITDFVSHHGDALPVCLRFYLGNLCYLWGDRQSHFDHG